MLEHHPCHSIGSWHPPHLTDSKKGGSKIWKCAKCVHSASSFRTRPRLLKTLPQRINSPCSAGYRCRVQSCFISDLKSHSQGTGYKIDSSLEGRTLCCNCWNDTMDSLSFYSCISSSCGDANLSGIAGSCNSYFWFWKEELTIYHMPGILLNWDIRWP